MAQSIHYSAHCDNPVPRPQGGILRKLFAIMSLSRQRRTLKDLDDHLLRDIGVTREEADIESKRQVWDVPDHWR